MYRCGWAARLHLYQAHPRTKWFDCLWRGVSTMNSHVHRKSPDRHLPSNFRSSFESFLFWTRPRFFGSTVDPRYPANCRHPPAVIQEARAGLNQLGLSSLPRAEKAPLQCTDDLAFQPQQLGGSKTMPAVHLAILVQGLRLRLLSFY